MNNKIICGIERSEDKILSNDAYKTLNKLKEICQKYTDNEQKCNKDCPFCLYNEKEGFTYCILRSIKPKNYIFK